MPVSTSAFGISVRRDPEPDLPSDRYARTDDRILVVEHRGSAGLALAELLVEFGYQPTVVASEAEVFQRITPRSHALLVCHVECAAEAAGFLTEVLAADPDLAVVALTERNDATLATRVMQAGAVDLLVLPAERDVLAHALQRALRLRDRRVIAAAAQGRAARSRFSPPVERLLGREPGRQQPRRTPNPMPTPVSNTAVPIVLVPGQPRTGVRRRILRRLYWLLGGSGR